MKPNLLAIYVLSVFFLCSFNTTNQVKYSVRKIIIDPGHGGKDPGTSGSFTVEKDIVLKVAMELKRIIEEALPGVEVILTRNSDSFPTLMERADVANQLGADLFISLHCNWSSNSQVFGSETYIMGLHKNEENFQVAQRENEVILLEENGKENYGGFNPSDPSSYILFSLSQNAYYQNSILLAQKIESQFAGRIGRTSRGVKSAGFWVLYRTYMPSVLVEIGYLSNKMEERELDDRLNQVYIASGIYRAFRDYKQEIELN